MNKILFFHPMIRNYRMGVFKLLAENFEIDFFLTSSGLLSDLNYIRPHVREEGNRLIKQRNLNFILPKQIFRGKINDFSLTLFKSIFWRKYKIHIYSGIISVPFLVTALPSKILGKKIIVFDELWTYPNKTFKHRVSFPLLKFLTKNIVDAFVVAGNKSKEMYIQDFAIPKEKIYIAYNTTVDLSNHIRVKKKELQIKKNIMDFSKDRKIILYLGRIVEYKGLDILIRSMLQIHDDSCLIVVGSGPFQHFCEKLVDELNLKERVKFFGGCSSDESLYYYIAADVFVLPTRFLTNEAVNCEAWGFTINEAMSLKIPVVSTNAVGSAYDLIIDGESGMIAEENNPLCLAEKINYLLESKQRKLKIGLQGRKRLRAICNYLQNLESYKKAIHSVMLK